MNKKSEPKEIDVDFNEALRRIAHTPKIIIDGKKEVLDFAPPPQGDANKDDEKGKS